MLSHWVLVIADFRREYAVDETHLAGMYAPEFWRLLRGLSQRSRLLSLWDRTPKHMHDPADRAALIAAARR